MRWFLKENFADEGAILCAYGILGVELNVIQLGS